MPSCEYSFRNLFHDYQKTRSNRGKHNGLCFTLNHHLIMHHCSLCCLFGWCQLERPLRYEYLGLVKTRSSCLCQYSLRISLWCVWNSRCYLRRQAFPFDSSHELLSSQTNHCPAIRLLSRNWQHSRCHDIPWSHRTYLLYYVLKERRNYETSKGSCREQEGRI